MKSILFIDAHPIFRDFIKDKLANEKVEISSASEERDAFTKTITNLPNLIIINRDEFQDIETEFLLKKASDPNTASIPIIITGPHIEKSQIGSLARYGVIKYFTKPVKFDLLFESIGQVLNIPITMDTTPCVLDIHRNGNIIFIEVAQGLNREKLALLKFKIAEMIEQEELENPKVIIMLSNLELSFIDGLNLEFLIDNVLENPKIHRKNVKILSLNSFIHSLVDGHTLYSGIEVSNNLTSVLNSLVESTSTSSVSDLITDRILSDSSRNDDSGSIETRFYSDSGSVSKDTSIGAVFSVAIIDRVAQSAEMTKQAFVSIGANTETFSSGKQFMDNYEDDKFDLLILDVMDNDSMGFEILRQFKMNSFAPPVIVYSPSAQRELIVKVLSAGASLYLTKPQKPEVLLNKAVQLLNKSN